MTLNISKDKLQSLLSNASEDAETIEVESGEVMPKDADVYSKDDIQGMVGERVNKAYDNAKKNILKGDIEDFSDFHEQYKTTFGLRPADEDPDAQIVAEKEDLAQQLNAANSKLENARTRELDQHIIEGARKAGVQDSVLEDSKRFVRMYRDDFKYDNRDDRWKLDAERGQTAEDLFNSFKEEGKATHLFDQARNESTGFEPANDATPSPSRISKQDYIKALKQGGERADELSRKYNNGDLVLE